MSPQDLEPLIDPDGRAAAVTAEVDAICRSAAFSRSPKLQSFLRYVCEQTLQGGAAQIKEYAVARDIFGRGDDYSPSEDSVVRRQAHALRQKLQEYYANEGREDTLKIELPVGRYVPVFRPAPGIAVPAGPALETPATPVPRHAPRVAALALGGLALLACGWLLGRAGMAGTASVSDPALIELWGPWLGDPAGAVICFSNRQMAIVRYSAEPSTLNLAGEMRASPAEDERLRRAFSFPATGYVYLTPSTGQTKMGEAIGAVNLANLLVAGKTPVRATQTRLLNWETLRGENLVVFGYSENNPWLDPLLAKYPFRLMAAEGDKMRRIVNTIAAPGERAEFQAHYSPTRTEPTREYALVSMIAGVDGRHRLLLISGLDAQSTQEASEYLTEPATVRQLLARMRQLQPGHKGPWRFQIVLEAEVRDKVPTRANLVAMRVL